MINLVGCDRWLSWRADKGSTLTGRAMEGCEVVEVEHKTRFSVMA